MRGKVYKRSKVQSIQNMVKPNDFKEYKKVISKYPKKGTKQDRYTSLLNQL